MNLWGLLIKLLPGFIPLFIFIIADELWGTRIGLYAAVGMGIIECITIYLKEKRIDKFVIIDCGLLVVLGAVSIALENDIFFKLKPGLIELILCLILGFSAFSSKNILLVMSKRFMKGLPALNEAQEKMMSRNLRMIFFVVLGHTALVFYSAYFMSKEAWAFISGGLFYILFGIYFLEEIVRNKIKRHKQGKEEWFPLVNEEGRMIGKAPRSVCHKDPGLLHPVVHLHVFNDKNEIFLQKRLMTKDIQPGKWDTSVGGHIGLNEDLDAALKREVLEELGIKDFSAQFLGRYIWASAVESELVFSFMAVYNGPIMINAGEIEEGRFWTVKEIRENLGKDVFTPNFENEFTKALQDKV